MYDQNVRGVGQSCDCDKVLAESCLQSLGKRLVAGLAVVVFSIV
jgi:hypothetical protein